MYGKLLFMMFILQIGSCTEHSYYDDLLYILVVSHAEVVFLDDSK